MPPDRVNVLRAAFDATVKDPAFLALAAKQGLDVTPASGVAIQKVVDDMLNMPKAVTGRLGEILGTRN